MRRVARRTEKNIAHLPVLVSKYESIHHQDPERIIPIEGDTNGRHRAAAKQPAISLVWRGDFCIAHQVAIAIMSPNRLNHGIPASCNDGARWERKFLTVIASAAKQSILQRRKSPDRFVARASMTGDSQRVDCVGHATPRSRAGFKAPAVAQSDMPEQID
ncbi:hypothetical protein [Bradyrhizobium sp.]|uniref:hypothetical protein n=1 Tax=Bradyrhizobium sp. TaxID=376 RepID=UPI003C705D5E